MSHEEKGHPALRRRLKFYGLSDYGTYYQLERVEELLGADRGAYQSLSLEDIIEFDNACQFVDAGLLPTSCDEEQQRILREGARLARREVGRFFNSLTQETVPDALTGGIFFDYRIDLIRLLAAHRVYERCDIDSLVDLLLDVVGVHLRDMLSSRPFTQACDAAVKRRLLSSVENAEILIQTNLERLAAPGLCLPRSMTLIEMRSLIEKYVDSEAPHPNFVELVSLARLSPDGVVTPQMKLKARRRHRTLIADFFAANNGGEPTGAEVSIRSDQSEPVVAELNGMVATYTYSQSWLEETLDEPSVLNNFVYLFEFVSRRGMLTLPSYSAERGTLVSLFEVSGRFSYPTGMAFRVKEWASSLQIAMYETFLRGSEKELEGVIAWFTNVYLPQNFDVPGLRYAPSSVASTYVEKCRHLFAEMESIARQFALFVETGEVDAELLYIASTPIRYREISSLLEGKHVHIREADGHVKQIMHLLFSDQSHITYLSEDVHADNLLRLLLTHDVFYDNLADYQKQGIDYLVSEGLLRGRPGTAIEIADMPKVVALNDIHQHDATNYYLYPQSGQTAIDDMVASGWLERSTTLLSEAEAQYFNYYLNQTDFSNGPDLRNAYAHGSNADAADESTHRNNYYCALRLILCLVLKLNDEFCIRAELADEDVDP